MNMLGAKKVRVHGMKSSRWTTKDKLTQYKGINVLLSRDKKVLSQDAVIAQKKMTKEVKQLQKDIKKNRGELNQAIIGDRQKLRTILQNNLDLQICFQSRSYESAIAHLGQSNFNKRKLLDRMEFRLKQSTQKLVELKLEIGWLEDRVRFEAELDVTPQERASQTVTGKVQDTQLKKEAALVCQYTYQAILKICKKDSMFFDQMLGTLNEDALKQSSFIVRGTELGQLATEYLDDLQQEFRELEAAVRHDMKFREKSLQAARKEHESMVEELPHLIRKDSDINTGKVMVPKSSEEISLQSDLDILEKLLANVRDIVYVSNITDIFPCMEAQQKTTERVNQLLRMSVQNRNDMEKKKQHGARMLHELECAMPTTTLDYRTEKKRLLDETAAQKKRTQENHSVYLVQNDLLVKVRSSLQQLLLKCRVVKVPEGKPAKIRSAMNINIKTPKDKKAKKELMPEVIPPPDKVPDDGNDIINALTPKLQILAANETGPLDAVATEQAFKHFWQLSDNTCAAIEYEQEEEQEFLEVVIIDPTVATYHSVKAESAEIYAENNIDPDTVPAFETKKKSKFAPDKKKKKK